MEEQLKQIAENTKKEIGFSTVFSSNTTDFTTSITPPLQLKPNKWKVGLIRLETYNSIPNITNTNRIFTYSIDGGVRWKTITLAIGAYDILDINSEIQRFMLKNGDAGITISANPVTLGSVVEIKPDNYRVNFKIPNSIASTLGFKDEILTTGYNISPNIVNIMIVNSILVNCSIIKNSYVNGSHFPLIYSFYPNVNPGYKIVEIPNNVVYLGINSEYINSIRIWLTDQNGNQLNLLGETVTIRLQFEFV